MISIPGGWAQFDAGIWTYKAEVGGVLYGNFSGEYKRPEDLPIELSESELEDLRGLKASYLINPDERIIDLERLYGEVI